MISRECFAGYVKDALADYYDPGHLQTNPLVELLVGPAATSETAATALRQLLREAIESLKPEQSVPFGRREWLGYRLLWLLYMQSRHTLEICEDLGLSRTSFYRCHQEALEAVTSYLWRMQREDGSRAAGGSAPALSSDEAARQEALKVARASRRQSTSLSAILDATLRTIRPLVDEQRLDLEVRAPGALPFAYGDPAILRQILLNVLTEGIRFAAGALQLSVSVDREETIWRLHDLNGTMAPKAQELPGILLSRSLLDVYGGRLWVEAQPAGGSVVLFAIPTAKPKTILIVDDNTDTIVRYQRCLQEQGYALRMARSGQEVQALLSEARPDLILLDVLMPQEDGWDILQSVKTIPETARIPVVICSVLSQPDLALALGAAEVLRKPISEKTLLGTVRRVLAQEDSAD